MGAARKVIHCNRGLAHQVELAECLRAGIPGAEISYSPMTEADIHITMGPWFAPHWKENTLYIDRGYWGDPDCVSIHWLIGGEKVRSKGNPHRPHPELKPMKSGSRLLTLCDYGETQKGGTVRRHPSDEKPTRTLQQDLESHDRAAGGRSTALVEAAIAGLWVETNDPHSPVYGITDREQWLHDLAWHNWSKDEIRRGDMWAAIR